MLDHRSGVSQILTSSLNRIDPAGYKLGLKLNMSKYWDKKGFKFFIVAILSSHKWTGPGQQYTQNITEYNQFLVVWCQIKCRKHSRLDPQNLCSLANDNNIFVSIISIHKFIWAIMHAGPCSTRCALWTVPLQWSSLSFGIEFLALYLCFSSKIASEVNVKVLDIVC